jgi:eukaryotic-like serine/threonine-protein kinase
VADDRKPKRPQRVTRTKLGVMDARQAAQDLVGKVMMERYLIEAEIGSGAMGTVYRGRHIKVQRKVAIKVLHEDYARNQTMLARFRREAEAAARLSHPNLSGVLDLGETPDGHPLMVMDLVDGASLRVLMEGSLARDRIINLVRQLLQGLDHAHAAGLVHRDLKPDNVIVELDHHGNEVPRIVDFGIAALRTEEAAAMSRLTETGTLLGTPLYMAPEQARGEEVDHRADLFALGVILFEMLSGTTPFAGSAMEIVIANMNEDIPPIAHRAPHANADPILELFMRRLAARDPGQRFASALEALAMLDLIERDPADAALRLGQMDVARALDVVWLPR